MPSVLRPRQSDAAANARREKAVAEAAKTRALVEQGKLSIVVDGIMDRFPKVMARLAK